jgi:hypothetical protein
MKPTIEAYCARLGITIDTYSEWLGHLDYDGGSFYKTLEPYARRQFLVFQFTFKCGELKQNLDEWRVRRDLDRMYHLHALADAIVELAPDGEKREISKAFCTKLIRCASGDVLYNLYIVLGAPWHRQEAEELAALDSLADKVLRKGTYDRDPRTQSIIRKLIASGARSKTVKVWRPEAICLSTHQSRTSIAKASEIRQPSIEDLIAGPYKALDLSLPEYEKWLKRETHKQLQGFALEERQGKSRRQARKEADLSAESRLEDLPDQKPTGLDGLIAGDRKLEIIRETKSSKYTPTEGAFIDAALDLFRMSPDIPDYDAMMSLCKQMNLTEANAFKIRTRIRKKYRKKLS